MYSTVSLDDIGLMMAAPVTYILIAMPVVLVVIVVATIWTKR